MAAVRPGGGGCWGDHLRGQNPWAGRQKNKDFKFEISSFVFYCLFVILSSFLFSIFMFSSWLFADKMNEHQSLHWKSSDLFLHFSWEQTLAPTFCLSVFCLFFCRFVTDLPLVVGRLMLLKLPKFSGLVKFPSLQDLQHIRWYPAMEQYRLNTSIRQNTDRSPRQRCSGDKEVVNQNPIPVEGK